MTEEQRRYLFVQSVIGSAIVNAILNGAIGWGITIGLTEFPVWRTPGAAGDFVATAFGVAFGTSLGSLIQIRIDLARGKISPPVLSGTLATWIARFPRGALPRAFAFGAIGAVLFGIPALAALVAAGSTALPRVPFVGMKAGFSAIEGGLMTPFILLATLGNVPGSNRQAS
jgi:hypothetical protein